MFFDLTKEITLDSKNYKTYRRWQAVVYFVAVILSFYLAYIIVFPTQYFLFSFPNSNSMQNTVISPRNLDGVFTDRGNITAAKKLIFDTALGGSYSKAQVSFTLDKNSSPIENAGIEARKSYQAFLYPEGDPLGFKDGTLVKNGNDYFIVSQGKLRKFANVGIIDNLGYKRDAFIEAAETDLNYNEKGDNLTNSLAYPDSSIFKINEDYYILENQKLKKFVSPQAYLTQYNENQAVAKDSNFLKNYPLDENLAGFRDGALISYGVSAYIVSSGLILPINNAATFADKGYKWPDVIAASGDEISLYQKDDKLFSITSPHPNGTVMLTDENQWYLIRDGRKHLLPSQTIAQSWFRGNPILVSQKSFATYEKCELDQNALSSHAYSCTMPLDNFIGFIGEAYEFKLDTPNDIKINTINVNFSRTASWANLKLAIRDLIDKIKATYVPQAPAQTR